MRLRAALDAMAVELADLTATLLRADVGASAAK